MVGLTESPMVVLNETRNSLKNENFRHRIN